MKKDSHVNSDMETSTVEAEILERTNTADWFKLTTAKLRFLFAYFFTLLLLGFAISICSLFFEKLNFSFNIEFAPRALLGGFGMSLTGSAVFYLRKLYKSSIKKLISFPSNDDEKIRALGVFFYFFLRPWFSLVFTLLIFVILESSVHSITTKETQFEIGVVYLMMCVSFFVGFASGDIVTYLETKAKEIATKRFSVE